MVEIATLVGGTLVGTILDTPHVRADSSPKEHLPAIARSLQTEGIQQKIRFFSHPEEALNDQQVAAYKEAKAKIESLGFSVEVLLSHGSLPPEDANVWVDAQWHEYAAMHFLDVQGRLPEKQLIVRLASMDNPATLNLHGEQILQVDGGFIAKAYMEETSVEYQEIPFIFHLRQPVYNGMTEGPSVQVVHEILQKIYNQIQGVQMRRAARLQQAALADLHRSPALQAEAQERWDEALHQKITEAPARKNTNDWHGNPFIFLAGLLVIAGGTYRLRQPLAVLFERFRQLTTRAPARSRWEAHRRYFSSAIHLAVRLGQRSTSVDRAKLARRLYSFGQEIARVRAGIAENMPIYLQMQADEWKAWEESVATIPSGASLVHARFAEVTNRLRTIVAMAPPPTLTEKWKSWLTTNYGKDPVFSRPNWSQVRRAMGNARPTVTPPLTATQWVARLKEGRRAVVQQRIAFLAAVRRRIEELLPHPKQSAFVDGALKIAPNPSAPHLLESKKNPTTRFDRTLLQQRERKALQSFTGREKRINNNPSILPLAHASEWFGGIEEGKLLVAEARQARRAGDLMAADRLLCTAEAIQTEMNRQSFKYQYDESTQELKRLDVEQAQLCAAKVQTKQSYEQSVAILQMIVEEKIRHDERLHTQEAIPQHQQTASWDRFTALTHATQTLSTLLEEQSARVTRHGGSSYAYITGTELATDVATLSTVRQSLKIYRDLAGYIVHDARRREELCTFIEGVDRECVEVANLIYPVLERPSIGNIVYGAYYKLQFMEQLPSTIGKIFRLEKLLGVLIAGTNSRIPASTFSRNGTLTHDERVQLRKDLDKNAPIVAVGA